MKIGMVGLGKMGLNMTKRLIQDGHEVVVYDVNDEPIAEAKEAGASPSTSHEDMVSQLEAPRTVWVMVPAGKITGDVIDSFAELLDEGDAIIDGGNSFYQDTLARVGELEPHGVDLLDAGTSGGVWGLKEGYSLMVGGPDAAVDRLRPIFETLAPGPEKGWGHVGKTGSGHFVKMVHNGIEYGMMEAYAEGFHIMHDKEEFNLDLHQIAEIWRYGSVVRSWLLDLASNALKENPGLEGLAAYVSDSGEGRWTVKEAIDLDVPAPVITLALMERLRSRVENSFTDRLLSALRNEFGGHSVERLDPDEAGKRPQTTDR